MGNVINFAEAVNARRVGAEITKREGAKLERIEQKVGRIVDAIEQKFGRPMPSFAVQAVAATVHQAEAASAPRFMPAYCDPANEVQGSKYQATKGMPVKEVAKRVRDDIKALGLPSAMKISVSSDHRSIDIRVKALPSDFPVLSIKAASWRKQFGEARDYPFAWVEASSDELRNLLAKLSAILASYNRDNSDSMSDYFDNRFYASAELDWQVRREHEAREVEASAGNYWADDQH
jgi:hypothetical protein